MTSPTINYRVADFLKSFLPFKIMNEEDLHSLSTLVSIKYIETGEDVFVANEEKLAIVKEGVVEVISDSIQGDLIDVCSEGDIIGVWKLYPDNERSFSTRVKENSLIFFLPVQAMEQEIYKNPKLALYFTSGFASQKSAEISLDEQRKRNNLSEQSYHLFRLSDIDHPRGEQLLTANKNDTIQQVASKMAEASVSSAIIVDEHKNPHGIITDRDLRTKIATGKHKITEKVQQIMSYPVKTIAENSTLADVHIAMLKHNIHHLCVTKNGTAKSQLVGIVTDTNLLVQKGNNPVVLISKINRSKTVEQLRELRDKADDLILEYLKNEVSIQLVSGVMNEINDAIIRKCNVIALEELGITLKGDYCWLSLGSEGRGEQLVRTDQDNALIYSHMEDSDALIFLAKLVNQYLNEIGFENCPAEMMASNPSWNNSLSEWKEVFGNWINNPAPKQLMHSTIFFDMRPVFGNENLADELYKHIDEEINKNQLFLNYLAANALQNPPPLSLFRNILVEKEGEHADSFDLKARALMPLVDAARALSFSHGVINIQNTSTRFENIASLEGSQKSLFLSLKEAYEWLLRIRALSAFNNKDTGRYVPIDQLNKWQRKNLKQAFKVIREVQQLLETRFQLNYLRR